MRVCVRGFVRMKQLLSVTLMAKELTITQLITKNQESSVTDDSFKID